MPNTIIKATGSYLPKIIVPNDYFLNHEFYGDDGNRLERKNSEIIRKLNEITGINERRYVSNEQVTSDIAHLSAEAALKGRDRETLDYIIVSHNYGDVRAGTVQPDLVPSIAARVKYKLGIRNPYTVAFDLPFGCPGWLQGVILSDSLIKAGNARRVLVIGAEVLSRVVDPHDVDGMIFADGAGATLLEATNENAGILSHACRTDTFDHMELIRMKPSFNPAVKRDRLFLKMRGHDTYKYVVRTTPKLVKKALDRAGIDLNCVNAVLLHQANEKMDEAILERLFRLYDRTDIPDNIMPMIISWAGNSSVATLPTILDLMWKGRLKQPKPGSGGHLVFAAVGAGMNINAMVYQAP